MGQLIFDNGLHKVLMFSDLVGEEADEIEAVQANQFLIIHGDNGIILDPGGVMTYNELYLEMSHYFAPKKLSAIFASHQDPDIVASLSRWFSNSETKLIISQLWARFAPHFCPAGKTTGRIIPLGDQGAWINIDGVEYGFLPAHFLHSVGNFQLYDPISKFLFSGDLGVSLLPTAIASKPVKNFKEHIKYMEAFHRRYMLSNKACRLWANMVRKLDIQAIIPQHGASMFGTEIVNECINWIENLQCGIDLIDQNLYTLPSLHEKLENMKVV